MAKAVGVKFPYTLKISDYSPGTKKIKIRDFVLVETGQGLEVGEVVYIDKEVNEKKLESPLKEVERVATKDDLAQRDANEEGAKALMPTFSEKIEKHKLPMNPVGVTFSFDETKAIFYFTAEGRIDFRELAKDLSRTIQKQAILRQIGPRDEAKLIGGYGRCGRPICCGSFLLGAEGVTMETVEKQFGGPRNASKISGLCGRLMCCLNFEQPQKSLEKIAKKELKND